MQEVRGFRVQGSGFRVQGSGFRVQGSGFRVQGSGFRVQGSGFRVQGSGFRVVQGLGVQGSGCGVIVRVQGAGHARFVTQHASPDNVHSVPCRASFHGWSANPCLNTEH